MDWREDGPIKLCISHGSEHFMKKFGYPASNVIVPIGKKPHEEFPGLSVTESRLIHGNDIGLGPVKHH